MASAESLQQPLLPPTHTDDKVDSKVEPVPLDQLPPSYQAASEAAAPPPADPDPDRSRCCRRRRRCRRFGYIFIGLFFLWLTARHIVRHCQLRRFAHPHADDFPWVGSLLQENSVERNGTELN